jgi:hypothetical protein
MAIEHEEGVARSMKSARRKGPLVAFVLCLLVSLSIEAWAEEPSLIYSVSFTDQELDDLLAPIALYPDPLLAQMLPASTYPQEILDAHAWLERGGNISDVDGQNWDESVKAVARYSDVLKMMAKNVDWTANLGDAFLNQPEDVSNSIQRLRWQAKNMGNLVSNDKQEIYIEGDSIAIFPVQPQYIYVPLYDPVIVYVKRPALHIPSFILFGPPLILGGWLIMDFDWGHRHVVYHGWNRPGWVNHARPFVHVKNVYINNSRPSIRQTWRHDASHGDPARYLTSRPSGPNAGRYARTGEIRGKTPVQPRPAGRMFGPTGDAHAYSNRGRESRGIVNQQPIPPAPSISQRPAIPSPSTRERRFIPTPGVSQQPTVPSPRISERRATPAPAVSPQPTTPTPHISGSGVKQPGSVRESTQSVRKPAGTFGGYRGADEAKAQSLRGQTSRQGSGGMRPSPAPVKRDTAPAGKDSHGDKQRR